MKSQIRKWSCGAAAVRNALRVYGKRVSEQDIWAASGTTEKYGTDEFGIMKAIRHFGFVATEHHFSNKNEAFEWLHETLIEGYPVILAVENWEHWVLAHGSLGSRVAIFDSSNFKKNTAENGSHSWDKKKLMYMWWNDRKSIGDGRLYAIVVKRK